MNGNFNNHEDWENGDVIEQAHDDIISMPELVLSKQAKWFTIGKFMILYKPLHFYTWKTLENKREFKTMFKTYD